MSADTERAERPEGIDLWNCPDCGSWIHGQGYTECPCCGGEHGSSPTGQLTEFVPASLAAQATDLDERWKAKFTACADQRDELACQVRELREALHDAVELLDDGKDAEAYSLLTDTQNAGPDPTQRQEENPDAR